jgi:hydrogenase maturation protease
MSQIAIVGVGNSLLSDDGAGIHVISLLAADDSLPDDVTCLDGGTVGLALLDRLAGKRALIVIDAARFGAAPGSVRVLENEAMDAHLRGKHGSVHEVGLSDLVDALRLTDALPARRALVGIEPASLDWGTAPTAEVARALPDAVAAVRALVARWGVQATTAPHLTEATA